jgi:hypothetical protein
VLRCLLSAREQPVLWVERADAGGQGLMKAAGSGVERADAGPLLSGVAALAGAVRAGPAYWSLKNSSPALQQ